MTTSFWQGQVRFRTVRVFRDRRGEPHVRMREAATAERGELWIETPAEMVEEALARAARVERAREHAEYIAAVFRQVHAIAGERNLPGRERPGRGQSGASLGSQPSTSATTSWLNAGMRWRRHVAELVS